MAERADMFDRIAAAAMWLAAGLVAAMLGWMLVDLAWRGLGHFSWNFLLAAPRNAGREGGIGPIIVSTFLIVAVCLAVTIPIGLGAAAALSEFSKRVGAFHWFLRSSLDALAAVPSIVFGLFGNVFFCHVLGMGFSILSGGLTLACMALPIVIRTAEQALRAVPDGFRHGAAALGLSRMTTLWSILLPHAAPGIAAGIILGMGRALAETAALLFTAGYVTRLPHGLFDSGRALSVHIYDLAMNVPGGNAAAYATAMVLVVIVLTLNGFTISLSKRWARGKEPA